MQLLRLRAGDLTRTSHLASEIRAGNRRALSRAITLVESSRQEHRAHAAELLDQLERARPRKSIRIGLTGTPGAGKSTFMDSFGVYLISEGRSVAVLAVDPTSPRAGGSILGDKTRMERLTQSSAAFIRPSPSGRALGGVARRSRECVFLCEHAGFDVVVVETTGVGQSESMVSELTDIFLLLIAPGGGDDLQGVKRGVTELADLVLVNKSDGELLSEAGRTCAAYQSALNLLRRRPQDPPGIPRAIQVSARMEEGIASVWSEIESIASFRQESGHWESCRRAQDLSWLRQGIQEELMATMGREPSMRRRLESIEAALLAGEISHARASRMGSEVVRGARSGWKENSRGPLDVDFGRQ